jgi:predicted aldo/keto reductase-like oxidoreductase
MMIKGKDQFSRREFLSKTFSSITLSKFLIISRKKTHALTQKETDQNLEKKIIYRTLGKTGISLPIVSMGAMNTLDSSLVIKSYEIGIRFFDTAADYMRGRNEEMLGNAIKELNARENVIIGTKAFVSLLRRGRSPKEIKEAYLKSTEESLKRLKTDYVDILYSHSVYDTKWLKNPGALEALQLLKEQKKTRFIGFTTHQNMAKCINEAAQMDFYDVICTSFNYTMSEDRNLIHALRNAASKGIGLMAMKTQCGGQYFRLADIPPEKKQLYKKDILHTAVLKWVLQNDFIASAVPGYTNFHQMEEDFSVAYSLEYTDEERKFLNDRDVKAAMGSLCHQCSRCVPSCPNQVDIPSLMRTHMYAVNYPNLYQAWNTLREIPTGKGLDICVSCDSCEATCIRGVDIASRIAELKAIYA